MADATAKVAGKENGFPVRRARRCGVSRPLAQRSKPMLLSGLDGNRLDPKVGIVFSCGGEEELAVGHPCECTAGEVRQLAFASGRDIVQNSVFAGRARSTESYRLAIG